MKNGQYKFIIFNGPPRSGKDTAVDLVAKASRVPVVKEKLAKPIKLAAQQLYGLTDAEWRVTDGSEEKDLTSPRFLGKTCREVQIGVSEVFMKPFHGDRAVFGHLLVRRVLRHRSGLFLISDGGFEEEIQPLIDTFGADNILVIRIQREGCSYLGDSRGYIEPQGVTSIDMPNTGSLDEFETRIRNACRPVLSSYLEWLRKVENV